jgi:oligopeptide transport system permease protein
MLVPLTAVLVYLLVMHLPYRQDSDRKIASSEAAGRAKLEAALGRGGPLDAWVPWQKLVAGESLAVRGERFTAQDFSRAVGTSLSLGGVALVFALAWAFAFALLRVAVARRRAGRVLEAVPGLVFGTPLFLLAVAAALVAVALDVTFSGSRLLAAAVMAVSPGTFIGVVFSDALTSERARPYFVTALAKGLTPGQAVWRHAVPNALPAMLDAAGPVAASLLAGSFVAESFFGIKGFGLVYLSAARNVEPGVVVVATTVFASLLIVVSLVIELVRLAVDPRARSAALEGGR